MESKEIITGEKRTELSKVTRRQFCQGFVLAAASALFPQRASFVGEIANPSVKNLENPRNRVSTIREWEESCSLPETRRDFEADLNIFWRDLRRCLGDDLVRPPVFEFFEFIDPENEVVPRMAPVEGGYPINYACDSFGRLGFGMQNDVWINPDNRTFTNRKVRFNIDGTPEELRKEAYELGLMLVLMEKRINLGKGTVSQRGKKFWWVMPFSGFRTAFVLHDSRGKPSSTFLYNSSLDLRARFYILWPHIAKIAPRLANAFDNYTKEIGKSFVTLDIMGRLGMSPSVIKGLYQNSDVAGLERALGEAVFASGWRIYIHGRDCRYKLYKPLDCILAIERFDEDPLYSSRTPADLGFDVMVVLNDYENS